MSEIPSIPVLKAIEPTNSGAGSEKLDYKNLPEYVEKNSPYESKRWTAFLESVEDSLDEESIARQLANLFFLKTALAVNNSNDTNHDLWSDRFTQASIELYGEPDKQEATRLIRNEYNSLLKLRDYEGISQQHVNYLIDVYKKILDVNKDVITSESEIDKEKDSIKRYGEAVNAKYKPLFDLVDDSGKEMFTAHDLKEIFNKALEWLSNNEDPEWGEWKVVDSDGTSLSVEASSRKIKIASRRGPATAKEARGLIAHELLVHALRSKNGYKTGDKKLATGLPGYLDSEEGLGILIEEAVNGELPDKAYDRFVDIAIALWSIDGVQKTRKELFEISFARQLIRQQIEGPINESEMATLKQKVWVHVDRIYRGGPGNDIGDRQPIFTKDIVYYIGYKQMAKFIAEQIDLGKSADEVLEYLSQAKIDPTNPKHVERLNEISSQNK